MTSTPPTPPQEGLARPLLHRAANQLALLQANLTWLRRRLDAGDATPGSQLAVEGGEALADSAAALETLVSAVEAMRALTHSGEPPGGRLGLAAALADAATPGSVQVRPGPHGQEPATWLSALDLGAAAVAVARRSHASGAIVLSIAPSGCPIIVDARPGAPPFEPDTLPGPWVARVMCEAPPTLELAPEV